MLQCGSRRADGVDCSCSNRRRFAPWCSFNDLRAQRSRPLQVKTIGINLATSLFQGYGITESDEGAFNLPSPRTQLLPLFARLNPCLVGMKASSTSHYWARQLTGLGH